MPEELFVGIASSDRRIVCGAHCTWWSNIQMATPIPDAKGVRTGKPLPGCPHCHSVLYQFPDMDNWMRSVQDYENMGHPGYVEFVKWVRGQCFPSWTAALIEYRLKTGKTVRMETGE